MLSIEQFSELLEILYSAPLEQTQWEYFLSLVCRHTQSSNGAFFCADSGRGLFLRALAGDSPVTNVPGDYNEHHAATDPFRSTLVRNGRTGVFHGDDLLPTDRLLQSDLYRGLLVHMGLRYGTIIPLTLSLRTFEAVSIWRTAEAGRMDEDSMRLLNLLFPHIQRALEISRVLGVTRERLAGAQTIADSSPTATFLTTAQGAVVYKNTAASNLLAHGSAVVVQYGLLIPADRTSSHAWRGLLQRVASQDSRPFESARTHALSLPCIGGSQPLQVLASRLPEAHRTSSGADILVLMADPQRAHAFPDQILHALYGLTPAETEIANGLLTGYSLAEIASLRQVSTGTVRIQVKSVLSKTGASRQSDLLSLPQPPA